MTRKAIIYDLDNTLYAVSSIGNELFASLFDLLQRHGLQGEHLESIKRDIMRKPFQWIADTYGFSAELRQQGIDQLNSLTFNKTIKTFPEYNSIKNLPGKRFLVTTGFTQLQWSKIRGMGIEEDFTEIHILDPTATSQTKKEIFADILDRYRYQPSEVLVVGDDPESELKAARELGIDTVLYDSQKLFPDAASTYRIKSLADLAHLS